MPTVGIKRDLLFKALGKTYSKYDSNEHVEVLLNILIF